MNRIAWIGALLFALGIGHAIGAAKIVGLTATTCGAGDFISAITSATPTCTTPATGSGTVNSGTTPRLAYYASNGTAVSDTANATITAGALALGASGTAGSVTMGNATSGTVKVQPSTGALGTTVLQVPGYNATATVAALDVASQTVTGGANVTSLSQSTGNITVDCGARPAQYITNGGAFTITAPANDGSCYLDVENNGSAGSISLSGFSPNTMGGATLDTTNGHNFRLVVTRVHAHSNIFAIALQ